MGKRLRRSLGDALIAPVAVVTGREEEVAGRLLMEPHLLPDSPQELQLHQQHQRQPGKQQQRQRQQQWEVSSIAPLRQRMGYSQPLGVQREELAPQRMVSRLQRVEAQFQQQVLSREGSPGQVTLLPGRRRSGKAPAETQTAAPDSLESSGDAATGTPYEAVTTGVPSGLSLREELMLLQQEEEEQQQRQEQEHLLVTPRAEKRRNGLRDNSPSATGIGELRILVVEDNVVNRLVVLGILKKMLGLRCDVAHNGREAVDACAKNNYDFIFMVRSWAVTSHRCQCTSIKSPKVRI